MQNAKRLCRTRELLWWHYPRAGVECPRVPIMMWPSHQPMSRALGLRQSISCLRLWSVSSLPRMMSGISCCIIWLRPEYRSLNGVDGLRPCLAPTLVRLREDGGGRDQHLNTVRVLWSCVVFCLSSDSGSDAGLGSEHWLRPGPQWLLAVRLTRRLEPLGSQSQQGRGRGHTDIITAVTRRYRDTSMRHLRHQPAALGHRRQCDVGLTPDYPVQDQLQSEWVSRGAGDTRACWHS